MFGRLPDPSGGSKIVTEFTAEDFAKLEFPVGKSIASS
jgi:hypothetical protein